MTDDAREVALTVNGQARRARVDPRTTAWACMIMRSSGTGTVVS